MPSRFYREDEDDRGDGRAIARIASWATVVMTPKQSGKACEFAGLDLGSPSETPNMAVDWDDGDG